MAVFGERRGDRRVLAGQAGSPVRSGPAQPGGQAAAARAAALPGEDEAVAAALAEYRYVAR